MQTGSVPPFDTDSDGDGTNDLSKFERRLHPVRPLPAGTHRFQVSDLGGGHAVCDGWAYRHPVDFVVTAPAGVVAESFFDPTATGSAITGTTTLAARPRII